MVKKELVKGTMLTALAALGISLNLCSGEFVYAADNQAVVLVVGSSGEATTVDAGGWRIEDGVPYWYENGVKQGTEGRGKEIYDPASEAWYWLDAVDGGKMAVSKDVYQESKADNAGNIGKWVRYDADGHMVKGWNTNENGRYYFDPVYGTMAKGDADIDGVHYYFNKDTGILESGGQTDDDGRDLYVDGWHKMGGTEYWYEGGIRQGVKYNADGSLDTSYRGKEIYDPSSNAWYWLDCVQNGAKAVSKDVYQESKADDAGNIGKWVRYDADGHMVKGWQTNEAGTYFFDYTYGTMMKGEVIMDGFKYIFDKATGILVSKEATTTTEVPHTHQYDSYSEGNYGRATCTICGKTEWVHLPLPTEHCPYPLHTKIYNDDGTITFYYVDSGPTNIKYGYDDGSAGSRAANAFDSWCEGNYYDRIGDDRVGDYAEGVVCRLTAKPYYY